jgi:hypothetical protein
MKKLIKYLSDYKAHSHDNYVETAAAIKEAKQVLIDGEGTREEREELLDELLHFKWVEGGYDHQNDD